MAGGLLAIQTVDPIQCEATVQTGQQGGKDNNRVRWITSERKQQSQVQKDKHLIIIDMFGFDFINIWTYCSLSVSLF